MDPTELQEQPESTIGHKPKDVHFEAAVPVPEGHPEEQGARREAAAEPCVCPPAAEEKREEDAQHAGG